MKLSCLAGIFAIGSLSLLSACDQSGSGAGNVTDNAALTNTSVAADQARQTADDVHSQMENRHGGVRMKDGDRHKMGRGMADDNMSNMSAPLSDGMDHSSEM